MHPADAACVCRVVFAQKIWCRRRHQARCLSHRCRKHRRRRCQMGTSGKAVSGGFPLTMPPKPDHEKRRFRFKPEGLFCVLLLCYLITSISPDFKELKCSVFGRFRALQSRNIYGATYHKRDAICLETQYYPNAMACELFEKPILRAGDIYHHTTSFAFSIR